MSERRATLAKQCGFNASDLEQLSSGLHTDAADQMIENAIGVFGLPLGVGLNFRINGRDRLIPMVVEEPSVVAAVSLAAKIVRESGGFTAEADESVMISQVQVTGLKHEQVAEAVAALELSAPEILESANRSQPQLLARGGGAREIEVRVLPSDAERGAMVVVHLLVDVLDAMGANMVNTMAEAVAPLVELLTGGKVYLRILSNLADQRCARASCSIALEQLEDFGCTGEQIAEGIVQAARFAELDPHRAATHNKGIMNGVDAVALATGNDWRAIEAGAHAFAAMRAGYRPLSTWWQEKGCLNGAIELPLAVGTVGGAVRKHPVARLALKMLGQPTARDLSQVMAAVGLAQNLAALRALGSVGIQKGHMALHTRGTVPSVSLGSSEDGGLAVVTAAQAVSLPRSHGRYRFRVPAHWKSPTGVNPYAKESERQIISWFARLGCSEKEVARAQKFDAAGYVGVPFPNLSPQLTTRIGKYLSMWLLWDDVHVETGENRWKISAGEVTARVKPGGMTRFDLGWWELYQEFAARRSYRWLDDICTGMVRWDDWARREAFVMEAVRNGGRPPRFDVQLEMRIETIGMYPTAYLLEDAYDFELPRAFHADPRTRRLKKLSNKIVGLGNDILSFAKDLAEGQINLISTFMAETHCSAESALEQILAMHDEALLEYDRVAAEVGCWGDANPYVKRWIQDIRHAAIGFSLWESQAPRYLQHRIVIDGQVAEPEFEFFEEVPEAEIEMQSAG